MAKAQQVKDDVGYASAAMSFDAKEVTIAVPLNGGAEGGGAPENWAAKLDTSRIDVPEKKIADSIRSNLAYILIDRDGAPIQPGSRSYERSWIRDGSLTSTLPFASVTMKRSATSSTGKRGFSTRTAQFYVSGRGGCRSGSGA